MKHPIGYYFRCPRGHCNVTAEAECLRPSRRPADLGKTLDQCITQLWRTFQLDTLYNVRYIEAMCLTDGRYNLQQKVDFSDRQALCMLLGFHQPRNPHPYRSPIALHFIHPRLIYCN